MGVTTASATAITIDEVLDLFYSLKAPYRNRAVFVMNDSTVKAIRKLKDGQGQYLWQPSVQGYSRHYSQSSASPRHMCLLLKHPLRPLCSATSAIIG